MEITYKITVQDWIVAYRIGSARFRFASFRGVVLRTCLIVLLVLLVAQCNLIKTEWTRQGVFPWHLLGIAAIGPAVVVALGFVIFWMMSAWHITLNDQSVTTRSKGGHITRDWLRVTDVNREGDYIAICSGDLAALVIPCRSFTSDQSADDFLAAAFAFWHHRHDFRPPVQDDATVWPPAPRSGNSAEPGDGREG